MDHESLNSITRKLEALDIQGTVEEVKRALDENIPPFEIVKNGLSPGMDKIGEKYETKEYFLSELSLAAYIMKGAMELLEPRMKASREKSLGRFLIGTVKGDLHDIGKNFVSMMLTSAGFEVYDLGVDVPDEKFLQKTTEIKGDFVGMSALLTTTMPSMRSVIEVFKKNGIREKVKIFVGGAAVTQSFADQIGADYYAKDAMECVRKARDSITKGK